MQSTTKADDRGYFVAKFLMADVKTLEELVVPGLNVFYLRGLTRLGEAFIGSDEVNVISREGPTGPATDPDAVTADR